MSTTTATRSASLARATRETRIELSLALEGSGRCEVATGLGFFDHMLTALGTHAGFDLRVQAAGDLQVDAHHTMEDVGIVLGDALREALGDKAGIVRFGHAYVPLDEALARAVVDLSGRGWLRYRARFRVERVGEVPTELFEDFFHALSDHGRFNLHLDVIRGRNGHHVAEAMFKAVARALRMAVAVDPRTTGVPSTKGVL
jgi:imidazoleglycerol-phosphate dehydratase